jgi:predicted RNase H-like HicB family nuclease
VNENYLILEVKINQMLNKTFNIIVEQGVDSHLISSVIELPGCHTQAKTYDELLNRTKEAIELYLDGKCN